MISDARMTDDPLPPRKCAPYVQRLAAPMFCLTLLFLVLLGGLTVVWVDMAEPVALPAEVDVAIDAAVVESVPEALPIDADAAMDATISDDAEPESLVGLRKSAIWTGYILFGLLVAIWPLFWLESVFCICNRRRDSVPKISVWPNDLWVAVCPPLRLAKPIKEMNGEIWLPKLGWHPPGKPLAKMLEKVMSKPMLGIALLILPILVVEFGFSQHVQSKLWLRLTLSISTGLIWCAFAIEFIIMVSATDRKFKYVKKNWIDLAIILLPLVSFLRSLRVVRAANIAKFAKVQQLSKMSRIYRMRGLMAKSIRALMVLEVMHRVLNITPEKRIERLKSQLEELEEEADELREQIDRLKAQADDSQADDSQANDSQADDSQVVDPSEQCIAQEKSETFRASAG